MANSKGLPQIDATAEFNGTPQFAKELIAELRKRFTMKSIATYSGISLRLLYYMLEKGINDFSKQLTLEVLAGRRKLDHDVSPDPKNVTTK